jgi:hypothetical protein
VQGNRVDQNGGEPNSPAAVAKATPPSRLVRRRVPAFADRIRRVGALHDIFRLAAVYFSRHREWPGELRLDAQRLHTLAHELPASDFQRICVHVRLRARRTPGASVGGRSVVQLTQAVAATPEAMELAAIWLGVQPVESRDAIGFDEAFAPRPETWGLRGDPHLWDALRRRFTGRPIPADESEITAVLYYAIREVIGCDIRRASEMVRVPAFVTGSGMSDGHVSTEFWVQRGVPLLATRASELTRA